MLGLVRLFAAEYTDDAGATHDLTGRRARVTGIRPDPRNPGQPDIEVALLDRDGNPGTEVTVKPRNVLQAPEKARIRERLTPPARRGEDSRPGQEFGPNTPEWNVAPNLKISRAEDDGHRIVVPKTEADMRDYPVESGQARSLADLQLRRELATEARYMGDKEIARILAQDSEGVWLEAVTAEKQTRDRKRAADQARQAAFVNGINEQVAQISTTDPSQRYQQLDALLGRLRWSPLDTDQTFDRLYPPDGGSAWTPERHALHEQMWQEIIDKVEAADIPREHKALVLGGLPGAGKTTILQPGHPAEKFGITTWNADEPVPSGATAVSVAPDNVKEMMIDHGMLPPGLQGLSPREQVLMMHEESTYLSNLFQTRLAEQGYNLVLDNMMDDPGRSEKRMAPLAREGYKFQGLFVDIPVEESQVSARQRYLEGFGTPKGGRLVPSTISRAKQSQHGNMSKNRDTFDTIVGRDWFTDWMVVDNTGVSQGQPRGHVTAQGTSDGSAAESYLPVNDADRLSSQLRTEGGFTLSPTSGTFVRQGVAVGIPGHSAILPLNDFRQRDRGRDWIRNYIRAMAAAHPGPNTMIGGWYDREHDEVVLDWVDVFADRQQGIQAGRDRNEQAVYDLGAGQEIPTGGTGGREDLVPAGVT